jgi:UDP-galactopyranose mutase
MNIKIIGCGLAGITSAIILKKMGHIPTIYEKRNHIGGNCFDSNVAGTLVHSYGPHIFHTDDSAVFNLLDNHTDWLPFELKPKGNTKLGVISLPYSRKTVADLGFELTQDQIIEYIFKDYSEKQWGMPFDKIPSTITNRIPKTINCIDPTWFEGQRYQCIPKYGYTKMFESMLYGIDVRLQQKKTHTQKYNPDLTIYTGKIDEYFNYCYGELPYRSLEFEHYVSNKKLNTFIINQNIKFIRHTREYDHRFFTHNHKGTTVITKEYSVAHNKHNIPFYPIPTLNNIRIYEKYKKLANKEKNTIFLGRLATYKYMDMWQVVRQTLDTLKDI